MSAPGSFVVHVLAATLTYGDLDVLPRNDLAFDSCCRAPPDEFRPRRKQHLPVVCVREREEGVVRGGLRALHVVKFICT